MKNQLVCFFKTRSGLKLFDPRGSQLSEGYVTSIRCSRQEINKCQSSLMSLINDFFFFFFHNAYVRIQAGIVSALVFFIYFF